MPEPETAKWEEQLLKATYVNAKAQLDIAILVADSLGKKVLAEHLQFIRNDLDKCDPHFK